MDLRAKITGDHSKGEMESCRVGEVDFSGSTYQIQVIDNQGDEFWPFLQFDKEGRLHDSLCSCESVAPDSGCIHLAVALDHIGDPPLHERFSRSLWNQLCQIFADRQGTETSVVDRVAPGHYRCSSVTGKRLFELIGDPVALEAVIERRVVETEENSLKFFGLSYEELARWREGRPSDALRYELSFWSDLAKQLFALSQRPYQIDFGYGRGGLPNDLHAQMEGVEVHFYLSEANLPLIVPYLSTVRSPLRLFNAQEEALEKITYDQEAGSFEIVAKEGASAYEQAVDLRDAIEVGTWKYIPEQGFLSSEEHDLLNSPTIGPDELSHFLDEHAVTVGRHLEKEKIHGQRRAFSYELAFDGGWNLHIKAYLFAPGDVVEGRSRDFGGWVYLDRDGFYPIRDRLFRGLELVIPQAEVGTFVYHHRSKLAAVPGFQTFLSTIESHFTYWLDDEDALHFKSHLLIEEESAKEFGDWVYLPGQGFFSKGIRRKGAPVGDGAAIPADEIALFLRTHQSELDLIEGFFSDTCPVVAASLKVTVKGSDQVLVEPEYRLGPDYSEEQVRFFGEWVYAKDEGFSLLPGEVRLPPRFRQPQLLEGKELELFLQYELETLRPYISSIDPRLEPVSSLSLVVEEASVQRSGLIDLEVSYQSERGRASARAVWRALRKGRRFLFARSGLVDLAGERFDWLRQLPSSRAGKKVQLTAVEFMRLTAFEQIECKEGSGRHLLESFTSFSAPSEPNLSALQSNLRHYQMIGVQWLWFLYHHGLSGLLCDDMGLGKTHQSMALLAAVHHHFSESSEEDQPYFLIVCPTSVIYHWQEKIHQFLPSMRLLVHYGPGRSLDGLGNYDIVLTSYGVLRSDQTALASIPFEVAVYDEIQVAKNHSSRTWASLERIGARLRLGLTGTPIENNLRELKALFDLVLPGYLPDESRFREQYIGPIEKENDASRKALLRRVIHPFVLRRKKEEVLTELPEKVEEKMHCELSEEQHRLYQEVLRPQRDQLIQGLESGDDVPYVHIFALLGALKQVCDHPALYLKQPQEYKKHASGKWELFIDLVAQARESGQKVVVFSHYLGMLDIIESYLRESAIGFAAVRGGTARRGEELRRFAEDPTCEVFVGSLQAVGLGVDLTAASVVIHYDRWWNAAREQQATDRVYRIGQTRGVQVFKLMTLGTLEEGIDQMIERKGELMEEVVRSDDQATLKHFSREELIQLLSFPQSGIE